MFELNRNKGEKLKVKFSSKQKTTGPLNIKLAFDVT